MRTVQVIGASSFASAVSHLPGKFAHNQLDLSCNQWHFADAVKNIGLPVESSLSTFLVQETKIAMSLHIANKLDDQPDCGCGIVEVDHFVRGI